MDKHTPLDMDDLQSKQDALHNVDNENIRDTQKRTGIGLVRETAGDIFEILENKTFYAEVKTHKKDLETMKDMLDKKRQLIQDAREAKNNKSYKTAKYYTNLENSIKKIDVRLSHMEKLKGRKSLVENANPAILEADTSGIVSTIVTSDNLSTYFTEDPDMDIETKVQGLTVKTQEGSVHDLVDKDGKEVTNLRSPHTIFINIAGDIINLGKISAGKKLKVNLEGVDANKLPKELFPFEMKFATKGIGSVNGGDKVSVTKDIIFRFSGEQLSLTETDDKEANEAFDQYATLFGLHEHIDAIVGNNFDDIVSQKLHTVFDDMNDEFPTWELLDKNKAFFIDQLILDPYTAKKKKNLIWPGAKPIPGMYKDKLLNKSKVKDLLKKAFILSVKNKKTSTADIHKEARKFVDTLKESKDATIVLQSIQDSLGEHIKSIAQSHSPAIDEQMIKYRRFLLEGNESPEFSREWRDLFEAQGYGAKLEQSYDEIYSKLLRPEFNTLMESVDSEVMQIRTSMTQQQKDNFFNVMIMQDDNAAKWDGHIPIDELRHDAIYTRKQMMQDMPTFIDGKINKKSESLDRDQYRHKIKNMLSAETMDPDSPLVKELLKKNINKHIKPFITKSPTEPSSTIKNEINKYFPKLRADDIADEVGITASLSNTERVSLVVAERIAGERVRERYQQANFFDKANLFLRRKYITNKYINQEMQRGTGLSWTENEVSAADRHQAEFDTNLSEVERIVNLTAEHPQTVKAIDDVAQLYIGTPPTFTGIADAQFQTKFDNIIRDKSLDPDMPKIIDRLNKKRINSFSTNVLSQVQQFKARQQLAYKILALNPDSETFDTQVDILIDAYMKEYDRAPDFFRMLGLSIESPDFKEQLKGYKRHTKALTKISAQTLKLNLQILNHGEESYSVDNKNHSSKVGKWMNKAGNFLDGPSDKRMRKHPNWAEIAGRTFGTAKVVGTTIAGVGIGGLLGGGVIATAGGIGLVTAGHTFLKKHSHHKKEVEDYIKNQATNLATNRAERERVAAAVNDMSRWKRRVSGYFDGDTRRMLRSYHYYIETTHDQLESTSHITDWITDDLESLRNVHDANEIKAYEGQLEDSIAEGLARLDYHKETKTNFVGSDIANLAEKEYNDLYQAILSGLTRLLRNDVAIGEESEEKHRTRLQDYLEHIRGNNRVYMQTKETISNGTRDTDGKSFDNQGFEEAKRKYKRKKGKQAVIGGFKAGAISFGLAGLIGGAVKGVSEWINGDVAVAQPIAADAPEKIIETTDPYETSASFTEQHELGKVEHDQFLDTNFDHISKTQQIITATNVPPGSQVDVIMATGVDATPADITKFSHMYTTSETEVLRLVDTKVGEEFIYSEATRDSVHNFVTETAPKIKEHVDISFNDGNPDLAAGRFLEMIEHTLEGAKQHPDLATIDFNFDVRGGEVGPDSVTVGTNYDFAPERTMDTEICIDGVIIGEQKVPVPIEKIPPTPSSSSVERRYLAGQGFDNTFKAHDEEAQKGSKEAKATGLAVRPKSSTTNQTKRTTNGRLPSKKRLQKKIGTAPIKDAGEKRRGDPQENKNEVLKREEHRKKLREKEDLKRLKERESQIKKQEDLKKAQKNLLNKEPSKSKDGQKNQGNSKKNNKKTSTKKNRTTKKKS